MACKATFKRVLANSGTLKSVFGKNVTLSETRIGHILARHPEMNQIPELFKSLQRVLEEPDYVLLGHYGEHIAIRSHNETRFLIVPYIEEGEVKTAFITTKLEKILGKRQILWKRL